MIILVFLVLNLVFVFVMVNFVEMEIIIYVVKMGDFFGKFVIIYKVLVVLIKKENNLKLDILVFG